MYIILSLIIILSILLVLVVLAQNSKGGGLSSQFGGSGASQLMGVKKTSDFLEKLTWGFAIAIMVLSLSTKLFIKSADDFDEGISSPNLEEAQEKALIPSSDANLEAVPADDAEGLEDLTTE